MAENPYLIAAGRSPLNPLGAILAHDYLVKNVETKGKPAQLSEPVVDVVAGLLRVGPDFPIKSVAILNDGLLKLETQCRKNVEILASGDVLGADEKEANSAESARPHSPL